MKTLLRNDAFKLWDQYWDDMKQEWFKIETLQDYTGEEDSPSLRAWLAGDKQKSLRLLKETAKDGWAEQCKAKHDQGVLMRRIRIIEKPYTPYTAWEIEFYKHSSIPNGEQVFVIDKRKVKDLTLPIGGLVMFDNKRVVVSIYDGTGRVTSQIFYEESHDIDQFLQLKHALLALAQPL